MLDAIQQGSANELTKQRLDELGERKAELETSIAREQIQQITLTKDQILFFFSKFRGGDIDDTACRRLIDSFVYTIYRYDDKVALYFNCEDGTQTIRFEDVKGFAIEGSTPPKQNPHHRAYERLYDAGFILLYCFFTFKIESFEVAQPVAHFCCFVILLSSSLCKGSE